jgi:hypothetical protein
MIERPQVPGRPGCIQRLVQFLLEPAAVSTRQRHTHQLDPLRQVLALLIMVVHRHEAIFTAFYPVSNPTGSDGPLALLGRQCIGLELEPRWGEVARTNLGRAIHGC